VFGNKASVLVGDFLFSRAFQLMVEDGSLAVLGILSSAAAVIAEGEVRQLATTSNLETTEADYLAVIDAKTATLFAAAARIGAVLGESPATLEGALGCFGSYLGTAFQLVDDALDYSASESALGKTIGDDFREGKVTLPVILAYRRGSADERQFWRRTLEELEQTDDDLGRAQALLERHGALADTIERAGGYGADAKDALAAFADGPERRALMEAVDFAVVRAF
jgi:octaprenyl-diphosphate synthase